MRAKLYRVYAGGKNKLVCAKSMQQAIDYVSPIAMGKHRANIVTGVTIDNGEFLCDNGAIIDFYVPIAF